MKIVEVCGSWSHDDIPRSCSCCGRECEKREGTLSAYIGDNSSIMQERIHLNVCLNCLSNLLFTIPEFKRRTLEKLRQKIDYQEQFLDKYKQEVRQLRELLTELQ